MLPYSLCATQIFHTAIFSSVVGSRSTIIASGIGIIKFNSFYITTQTQIQCVNVRFWEKWWQEWFFVRLHCRFALLNPSCPDLRRRGKVNLNLIFTLVCDASNYFMRALKAFRTLSGTTKKFEKKLRITFVSIQLSEMHRVGRINNGEETADLAMSISPISNYYIIEIL